MATCDRTAAGEDFAQLLPLNDPLDPGASTRDVSYVLNADDELVSVNDAWGDFARSNLGGRAAAAEVLGRKLWDFIAGAETRLLYRDILHRVRRGNTLRFNIRCDAPDRRRLIEVVVAPAAGAAVEFHTRVLWEEAREWQPLLDPRVAHTDEFLHLCAWCKKVQVGDEWLEVEDAVTRLALFDQPALPQLSHGLCPACDAEMQRVLAE